MHPRFPRGSPTGRGGPGAAPGHRSILEGLGVGSWDKVLLSCLWPLEQWPSPRRQVQAKDKGTWGGHRSIPEMRPVGSRSHDTKLPRTQLQETGGHLRCCSGDRHGQAGAHRVHTSPGSMPHPSSLSEAAAEPRSPLRGAAPAHSPQNNSRTAAGRSGRPAFQSE